MPKTELKHKIKAKTSSRDLFVRKLEFQGVSGQNRGLKRNYRVDPGSNVQKLQVWTAGSISRKLGGFCVKF